MKILEIIFRKKLKKKNNVEFFDAEEEVTQEDMLYLEFLRVK